VLNDTSRVVKCLVMCIACEYIHLQVQTDWYIRNPGSEPASSSFRSVGGIYDVHNQSSLSKQAAQCQKLHSIGKHDE
jgi:hypothetical protein